MGGTDAGCLRVDVAAAAARAGRLVAFGITPTNPETGYGYVEAGYGYDNNVQSATSDSSITVVNGGTLVLPPEALRKGDQYRAVAAGGELAYGLTQSFGIYGGADVRARFSFDRMVASVESVYTTRLGLRAPRLAAHPRTAVS